MWWFIAGLVISLAIALLTPKPKSPDQVPAGLKDFTVPTVSESRNISILFGKDVLDGPNVINYGGLKTIPIEESTGGGLFGGGDDVIVGFMYFLDMDFSLCWGPLDGLHEIRFGDYVAWTGNRTTPGIFSVSAFTLFGGNDAGGGGGVQGKVAYYVGDDTQVSDSYLNSRLGVQPGNRRVAHLVWRGGYIGNSQYIKPVSFIASRYPNTIGLSGGKHIIGEDANPACIIAEMFTSKLFGKGYDSSQLNLASFISVGEDLYDEGFGLSFVVDSPRDCEAVIDEVLRHINATRYTDLSTGKITLKLIREDYEIATLPVLDESTIIDVEDFTRGSIGTIATEVRIKYRERSANYKERIYLQPDIGARHQLGFPKPVSIDYLGIMDKTIAAQVARRELLPLSKTPASCTVVCDRNHYDLVPGSVFNMAWSPGEITQIILRVKEIDYGTLTQGEVRISVTEDLYALDEGIFEDNPSSGWVPITGDPLDVDDAVLIEMPYWNLQGEDPYRMMVFAPSPRGDHVGFHLWYDPSWIAGGYLKISANLQRLTYPMSLAEDLPGDGIQIEVNYEPTLFPKNVTEYNILHNGMNILLLYQSATAMEFVGFTGYVDNEDGTYSLTGVLRGLIDTTPIEHLTVDTVVFALDGGYGVNDLEAIADNPTNTNQYKIESWTQSLGWDISDFSTTVYPFTLQKRCDAPLPPGRFYTNGEEFPAYDDTDLTFTWAHREKTTETQQKQSDSTGTLPTNVTYTIEIRNPAGSLIRTYSGLTGTSQAYSVAQMTTDNGGSVPLWIDVTAKAVDSGVTLSSLFPQKRRIYTSAEGPQALYSVSLNSNNSLGTGYNIRNIIPAAALLQTGSTVRVRVRATTNNIAVDSLFIGHPAASGDNYDFDGNQVEITFNTGQSGFSVTAGNTLVSDDITFDLDPSKPIIFSYYLGTLGAMSSGSLTGALSRYKLAADESGISDVTGYSSYNSNQCYMIDLITDPTL